MTREYGRNTPLPEIMVGERLMVEGSRLDFGRHCGLYGEQGQVELASQGFTVRSLYYTRSGLIVLTSLNNFKSSSVYLGFLGTLGC